jgi:Glycosyl hydrolase catalytic core
MRRAVPLAVLVVALLAALPSPASAARIPIRVGIGDQSTGMFDQPAFQRAGFKRVRYFVPWNVMDDPGRLVAATQFVQRARRSRFSVLIHVSTDNYTIKKARLPSVAAYTAKVGRLVKHFRSLGVTDFGTWNEANHASQPTYRSPTRAAAFFRALYRMVKPHCSSCGVVALDVLDQVGVEKYMRSFFRALSPTFRRRASVVGIHNYGDVNRRRTTFTRAIIRQAHHYNSHARFWFTETGGIVKFGRSFPCNAVRAANRIGTMFSLARTFRRSGVTRLYVYNWTGAGCSARFDAGLTTPSGTPRKGYGALRRQLVYFER